MMMEGWKEGEGGLAEGGKVLGVKIRRIDG